MPQRHIGWKHGSVFKKNGRWRYRKTEKELNKSAMEEEIGAIIGFKEANGEGRNERWSEQLEVKQRCGLVKKKKEENKRARR